MADTIAELASLLKLGPDAPLQPPRFAKVVSVAGDDVTVTLGGSNVEAVRCCACSTDDVVLLETMPSGQLAAVATKGASGGGGGSITSAVTYYAASTSTEPLPPTLPIGYSQVEYIQTDGTAWIDTGIQPALDFEVKAKVYQPTSGDQFFMGARKDTGNTRFYPIHVYSGEYLTVTGTWANYPGVTPADTYTTPHVLDSVITNGTSLSITVDGVPDTGTGTITESTLPTVSLPIFGGRLNNGQSITRSPSGSRCYYAKIYSGGVLVRDFVAVIDNLNRIGLYDFVSETFFGNAAQYGAFTAGPVISVAWSTDAPQLTEATPYLWAFQEYTFTDGTTYTTPVFVANRYEGGGCTPASGGDTKEDVLAGTDTGQWHNGWREEKFDDGRLTKWKWQRFTATSGFNSLSMGITDGTAFSARPDVSVTIGPLMNSSYSPLTGYYVQGGISNFTNNTTVVIGAQAGLAGQLFCEVRMDGHWR